MVGKWTNEPCSEVDEVVNHFWVLTNPKTIEMVRMCGKRVIKQRHDKP